MCKSHSLTSNDYKNTSLLQKHHQDDFGVAGEQSTTGKKETRSSRQKEKREKTDEEKELRKERKLGRKRDRAEDAMIGDLKRRKDEEKGKGV